MLTVQQDLRRCQAEGLAAARDLDADRYVGRDQLIGSMVGVGAPDALIFDTPHISARRLVVLRNQASAGKPCEADQPEERHGHLTTWCGATCVPANAAAISGEMGEEWPLSCRRMGCVRQVVQLQIHG